MIAHTMCVPADAVQRPCRTMLRRAARLAVGLWWAFSAMTALTEAQDQSRIVELEVAVPNMQSGEHQAWAELLSEIGADSVRLKGAGRTAQPGVSEESFGGRTHVLLRGVLRGDNRLELPGGAFRQSDLAGLRELVSRYRADGAQTTITEKVAFGLTPEQLVGLSEQLATAVDFSTSQQPIAEVAPKIAAAARLELEIGRDLRSPLAEAGIVLDELKGLSAGTALAAALRPAGFVLVPTRPTGGQVKLQLQRSDAAQEFWPVGWPPETSPLEAAPAMYERLAVQINNTPLLDALAAIKGRTGIPMLFDHNSLALKQIDLAQRQVSLNQGKDTYYSIVRELLRQGKPKMRLEIRQDEALQPFVWISPQ